MPKFQPGSKEFIDHFLSIITQIQIELQHAHARQRILNIQRIQAERNLTRSARRLDVAMPGAQSTAAKVENDMRLQEFETVENKLEDVQERIQMLSASLEKHQRVLPAVLEGGDPDDIMSNFKLEDLREDVVREVNAFDRKSLKAFNKSKKMQIT